MNNGPNSTLSYSLLSNWPECAPYLKIHARTPRQVYDEVVKRERAELERQYEAEKDQPEVCFVSEALGLLAEREDRINDEIKGGGSNHKEVTPLPPSLPTSTRNERGERDEKKSLVVKVDSRQSIRYVDAFNDETAKIDRRIDQDSKGWR